MGVLIGSFLAGLAGALSPCILPLLPLVFIAASAQHWLAPIALAFGVALSYTLIGIFLALVGYSIGFDEDRFRMIGALLLVIFGCVLLVPSAEEKISSGLVIFGNRFATRSANFNGSGFCRQFILGLLLGAAWGPCVGPTLGLASAMAMRGENLSNAAAIMIVFSIGATLPLLLLGMISRDVLLKWHHSFFVIGRAMKIFLGSIFIVIGTSIVLGADRQIEAFLESTYPQWLIVMITQY